MGEAFWPESIVVSILHQKSGESEEVHEVLRAIPLSSADVCRPCAVYGRRCCRFTPCKFHPMGCDCETGMGVAAQLFSYVAFRFVRASLLQHVLLCCARRSSYDCIGACSCRPRQSETGVHHVVSLDIFSSGGFIDGCSRPGVELDCSIFSSRNSSV